MDMLNSQPEIFDSIMPELTASLEKCIYDEYSLTAAINEIIEQVCFESLTLISQLFLKK